MSIFASQTKSDPISIPFDAPHTIVVRKLTGREYEAACEAHRGSVATGRPNAWPALFRKALTAGASDPDVLKAVADPLTGHDRYALVRAGLVSWSYTESIKVLPAVGDTPAIDAVGDLDDEAIDFIATEVLRLTKPALFVAPEAVEDANTQLPAAASAA